MVNEANLLLILAVSFLGWKTKNLSGSGAIAAFFTGITVVSAFGWKGLIVLGAFFGTSSLWSKFRSSAKAEIEKKLAKTSERDWQQVVANGGSALIFSLLYIITDDAVYMLGAFTSLAAANADTWASEIGPLSKSDPISIRNLARVEKGSSGAVSLLGTLASLAGSLLIALISILLFKEISAEAAVIITCAGFFGSLADTILGAYVQIEYRCRRCGLETESPEHCGVKAEGLKGFSFINNEFVNFSSSFLAGSLTIMISNVIC
ncbi:DUF92 domain-containing protein [Rossellomorea vietnamensis]|uniref:DUF92 domain-containing protein n=1 Tax=Rossellomorea vietnamensis TaxID=218284 RepID=A0A5D4P0E6_9BACI|nr:DUF92 domain-containing protein [Rossellomorea vietnamensis]